MRHAIETAPRDEKAVILEDDASGTYEVAHWSAETGEWVGENGEPSKITPSHWYAMPWYPMPRDKYLSQEHDGSSNLSQVGPPAPRARRRFAAPSIIATLVAAALIGLYFEQEPQLPQDARKTDLLTLRQQAEADQAAAQEAAQVKQPVEPSGPQARQSLEKEQRSEVLANELADARRAIDGLNLQLRAEAAKTAQLLGQEREKMAALVQDATAARQALKESTEQHRQVLEEERARSAALASELAKARGEVETQAALLHKAGEESVQLKQVAESAIAELRQSLAQERDRTEAMARDLESARRPLDERVTNSDIAQPTGAAQAPATEQPAAAEAQDNPEATRLIARASALLGQGNIGAARMVLEHVAEKGSAEASFMIAETYDRVILSGWGTYGTRGEATKARELYAKAHAGGIQEAKDRLDKLGQ